jgi:SAM-dependent methyltransferase
MIGNRAYYDDNYRSLLPASLDAAMLDLGCGQGDLSRYLSDLGYRNVTAVDRDSESVAGLANVPGVHAKAVDVNSAAIERRKGGWTLIVAKQMIYYFDRREGPGLIASLHDALAPDGRLIVEIFNGGLLSSRFTELKDPGILTAYTELGLRRLLEQNGFIVESITGAQVRTNGLRGLLYAFARELWFRLYRLILIIERGRDGELPTISSKTIIAVARRR